MKLFKKPTVGEVTINTGSGVFAIKGGKGHEHHTITVYYYRPKNFTPDSRILLVIPGAGRDADEYRNDWIAASEKHSVMILSPQYAEAAYGFGDYYLASLVKDLNLNNSVTYVKNTNMVELDEERFTFQINPNADQWLFNDFDRIFDLSVQALGSQQTQYDIFGHSAGGQILHRMAIFHPRSKAHRILASNSGFYTLPDVQTPLPFGIKATPITKADLQVSFAQKLTLFIGELDNANETGGTLLRSPSADTQGLHRLARSQYFYEQSKKIAADLDFAFNWTLEIVPGVGHDHRRMSEAAVGYLYGKE